MTLYSANVHTCLILTAGVYDLLTYCMKRSAGVSPPFHKFRIQPTYYGLCYHRCFVLATQSNSPQNGFVGTVVALVRYSCLLDGLEWLCRLGVGGVGSADYCSQRARVLRCVRCQSVHYARLLTYLLEFTLRPVTMISSILQWCWTRNGGTLISAEVALATVRLYKSPCCWVVTGTLRLAALLTSTGTII